MQLEELGKLKKNSLTSLGPRAPPKSQLTPTKLMNTAVISFGIP
jgi:hypothetical protein